MPDVVMQSPLAGIDRLVNFEAKQVLSVNGKSCAL